MPRTPDASPGSAGWGNRVWSIPLRPPEHEVEQNEPQRGHDKREGQEQHDGRRPKPGRAIVIPPAPVTEMTHDPLVAGSEGAQETPVAAADIARGLVGALPAKNLL